MYQVKYFSGHLQRYISKYFPTEEKATRYMKRLHRPNYDITLNKIEMDTEEWEAHLNP